MRRRVTSTECHRITSKALYFVAVFCLALSPVGQRQSLQAQVLTGSDITTVAKMDSLFRTHYSPDVNPGKGSGWKPFSRMEWFYGQRAYPSGQIPAGARMEAWQAKMDTRRRDQSLDESWTSIGPSNFGGRILSIAWHPTSTNILYAGSASGGLWKSTNTGSSWLPLTDELPTLAVGAVALDPSDPAVVYIGTGEGSYNVDAVYGCGIFKSTDSGANWTATGMSWTQSQGRAVNKILVHPTNPLVLWAATNSAAGGGVYKSTDGGSSWARYLAGDAKELLMHPDSAAVLYAALGYAWGSASNGIYRSSDGGLTWSLVSGGLPAGSVQGRMSLTMSRSTPQTLYTGISQTISSGAGLLGVYKTTNCGASWTLQATTPNFYNGQGWYNNVCEVHPTNPAIVFSAGLDCYKSTNSGASWTQKTYWHYPAGNSQYVHADHHVLAFKPGDPNTIIVGTDGGLSKSTNGGDTWSDINTGLSTFQFYAMGNDPLNPTTAYGGTQDNGTDKYSGSTSWSAVYGGDGGFCTVDYTNSNILYVETQRGSHFKTTNGGTTFTAIQSGITGTGAWVTPFAIDPTNPAVLYTATTMVYKSTNGGTNWSAISPALCSAYISTIAVAPSNTQVIYTGCEGGGDVWKTTNGGANWSDISTGLPDRYVTRVAVDPVNAAIVYACVSGYGTGHVWKSTNGGTAWTNRSTGLPDIPCNVLVVDPDNANQLYAGTDLGVYASTDGGTTWTDYSAGLPNVVVDDLALHPGTGMLRAATHGRGMWQTSTGASSIAVLSPNGGESWATGSTQYIAWSTGGFGGTVSIELMRSYPGGTWETVTASTANTGSYAWLVSGMSTSSARVRVISVESPAVGDTSAANFTITQPRLILTAPLGGEVWAAGDTGTVAWTLSGASGSVAVQINRSYPSGSWTTLTATSGTSYRWPVTIPTSSTVRIRAYLMSVPSAGDTCETNLSIVEPALALNTPNGGESLVPGATHVIRWSRQNYTGSVKLELNRAYPGAVWDTIRTNVRGDTLAWTVGATGTSAARVRVTATTYPLSSDMSSANFSIRTPSLAVTYPNGGEIWSIGSTYTLRWTRSNLTGPVNVYINRTYPAGEWVPVGINVGADTLRWIVSEPYASTARVRVTSVNVPTYYDESDADFVLGAGIVMTAPNGGESWSVGSAQTIGFTRFNAAGNATVQLNRSYPTGSWETLSTTVSGSTLAWTVTGPGSTTARIRVFLTGNPTIGDTSNANFIIPAPLLTLTVPNGTENWNTGSQQTVSWTRAAATGDVTVQLNRSYPSGSWETLTTTASTTSYVWTVTTPTTTTARVRIFLTASPQVGDTSAANFTIRTLSLTLQSPNGGEVWPIGSLQTIRWVRSSASGNVAVLINRTYPTGSWTTLTTSASSDSFNWTVAAPASANTRIRIYLVSNSALGDTSAADYSLVTPAITVTSPNGGEAWVIGRPYTINFTRSNAAGSATVQLNRAYPTGSWETISSTASGNSVDWTPTGTASTASRVRVFLNAIPAARDSSNANFTLLRPTLTITAPNGGESWATGSQQTFSWTRANAAGPVLVELNRSYPGATWETLAAAVNDDTYSWTVTGPGTTTARLRISLAASPATGDSSNANFALVQPTITLTTPDGGGTYTIGSTQTIRWTRAAASGPATVFLNRAYPGGVWETLASGVAADTVAWRTAGAASPNCRIRVWLNADTTVRDQSSSDFTLMQRSLDLSSPNGGETLYIGSVAVISFVRTNSTGTVTVQLNRNYPGGSWETLTSSLSTSSFNWTVSGAASSAARIRIFSTSESFIGDTSSTSFIMAVPSLALQVPNGGEQWTVGTLQTITWQRNGVADNVRVELKRSYPAGSWEQLATGLTGSSYDWTVSGAATAGARLRVASVTNALYSDTSAAAFSIVAQQVSLLSPNGGDSLAVGLPFTFRWSRTLAAGDVQVEINRAYPSGSWEAVGTSAADSLVWTVSGALSNAVRARVFLISAPAVGDTSAASVSIIQPALVLVYPAGGERWLAGQMQTVQWAKTGLSGTIRMELNSNYPSGGWSTIATGRTGLSTTYILPSIHTLNARLRVVYENLPQFADTSGNFSIEEPQLRLTLPSGGETLVVGTTITVQVTATNLRDPVQVQLNRNYPGGVWETIVASTTELMIPWTVAGAPTTNARFRVLNLAFPTVGDSSDANVSLLNPGVHLWSPVGGEHVWIGSTSTLRWTRSDGRAVNVALNRRWPTGAWETLAANFNGDSLVWSVTGPESFECRVRVSTYGADTISDQSAANFSIESAVLTLDTPQPGDTLAIGFPNTIHWLRNGGVTGPVRVELDRSYPSGTWSALGSTSGSELAWTATGPATTTARLRILAVDQPAVGDTVEGPLSIAAASLALTSPDGGAYGIGQVVPVAWTREGVGSGVNLYYSRDGLSGPWYALGLNILDDHYNWTATGPRSTTMRFRIVSARIPALADTSGAFTVQDPGITLTAPNSGVLGAGNVQTISWTRVDFAGAVSLDYTTDYPAGAWASIATGLTGSSYAWTVPAVLSSHVRVRVRSVSPVLGDTSSSDLSIVTPLLTVTSPNGGEILTTGNTATISWTRLAAAGSARVELNRSYPGGSWEVLGTGQTDNALDWTVNGDFTHGRVRVSLEARPEISDVSNGDFGTRAPELALVRPAGGDTLVIGQSYTIRFSRGGLTGPVKVELNRAYPAGSWEVLSAGTSADSLVWLVSGTESATARMRVSLNSNPTYFDESDRDCFIARQGITLVTPAAGDSVAIGMPVTFAWTSVGVPQSFSLYVKRTWPSGTWELLNSGLTGSGWTWTAAGAASETARFRLLSNAVPSISDTTDGPVRIGQPSFVYLEPHAADTFLIGEQVTLRWGRLFAAGDVHVELSRGGTGGPWEDLGVTAADSLVWTVTGPATNILRLRLTLASASWVASMTPYNCVIGNPVLTFTAPAAGTAQAIGRSMTATWTRSYVSAPVDVLLQRTAGGDSTMLRTALSGDSLHWTASGPDASAARLILRTSSGLPVAAQSNAFVLGTPALTVTAPAAGSYVSGGVMSIRWRRAFVNDAVRVELNRDYPDGGWTVLAASVADTQMTWTVSGPTTVNARLRITSTVDPLLTAVSPVLQLLVPNLALADWGQSTVPIGFPLTVRWTRTAASGGVNAYLSRDGGVTWPEIIVAGTTADTVAWTPQGAATAQARVRVQSVANPGLFSVSPVFSLVMPQLSWLAPASGQTLAVGGTLTLRWTEANHPADVQLMLNRTYPAGSWETVAANLTADSLEWLITGPASTAARFRVVSARNGAWFADSPTFELLDEALAITDPAADQTVVTGDTLALSWQRTVFDGEVRILLWRTSFDVDTLVAATAGNSARVEIPEPAAEQSYLIVEDAADGWPRDSVRLSGPFAPSLQMTEPVSGSRWVANQAQWVHWSRTHAAGEVTVQVMAQYPDGVWESAGTSASDSVLLVAPMLESDNAAVRIFLTSRRAVRDSVSGLRVVQPSLTLADVAESRYRIGAALNVSWHAHEILSPVRLELNRSYPAGVWEELYTGSDTLFAWTVAGDTTQTARLRVLCSNGEAADTLERDLVFYQPGLDLILNRDGDSLYIGRTVSIGLDLRNASGRLDLALQREPGGIWETVFRDVEAGVHAWNVTGPAADNARLKAFVHDDPLVADSTDVFAIVQPTLQFTNTFGESYASGDTMSLSWTGVGARGPFRLLLRRDAVVEPLRVDMSDLSTVWTVTPPSAAVAQLILQDETSTLCDTSAVFAIHHAVLHFTNPAGAGVDTIGTERQLEWQWVDGSGAVRVELARDSAAALWETVADSVSDTHCGFTLTGPETNWLRYRVTSRASERISAVSEVRQLVPQVLPFVQIVAPNGGETLRVNDPIRLRWTSAGLSGDVGIGLWRGAPVNRFDTLFVATANDSSEIWTVTGPDAVECFLIVVSLTDTARWDTSDARFVITGGTAVDDPRLELPRAYALSAPYPNPFNSSAVIEFALPRPGAVRLAVYDLLGREVAVLVNGDRRAGLHRITWNGSGHASGMYFLRMDCADFVATRKLHLIK